MVIRSTVAGVAGILMMIAAGSNPVAAQGACPPGCDGATNWSGFWLGAGVGGNLDMITHNYVEKDNLGAVTSTGNDDTRGGSGFVGTVGIGYDWQVRDRWVLGAFTDFDFGKTRHSEIDYTAAGGRYGWNIDRNSTWTIGARIGLLTSNTSMFYGLIGYSRTDADIEVFQNDGAGNSSSVTRNIDYSGLVLGGGLEQDLGSGFSLKGEYRYTNFGEEGYGSAVANLAGTRLETDEFGFDSHSIRLTLAYKFGRPADVIEEVSYKDIPPAPAYSSPYK
jgi:outer membrane immunogenic protein